MQRDIDPALMEAYRSGKLRPFVLAQLTFKSKTEYAWTGVGTLVFGGNSYLGVGVFGRVGTTAEGTEIRADGITVGLTGGNPDWYQECVDDIQQGLPAKLLAGTMTDAGVIVGAPYMFFDGHVDDSDVDLDPDNLTITLNLENAMEDLQRAPMLRLTSADQAIIAPSDSSLDGVERLNDAPLRWG